MNYEPSLTMVCRDCGRPLEDAEINFGVDMASGKVMLVLNFGTNGDTGHMLAFPLGLDKVAFLHQQLAICENIARSKNASAN